MGTVIRNQMSRSLCFGLRKEKYESILNLKGLSTQHHGHSATEINNFSEQYRGEKHK